MQATEDVAVEQNILGRQMSRVGAGQPAVPDEPTLVAVTIHARGGIDRGPLRDIAKIREILFLTLTTTLAIEGPISRADHRAERGRLTMLIDMHWATVTRPDLVAAWDTVDSTLPEHLTHGHDMVETGLLANPRRRRRVRGLGVPVQIDLWANHVTDRPRAMFMQALR